MQHVDDSTMEFFQAAVEGENNGILAYIKDAGDVNTKIEYYSAEGPVSALMLASQNGHAECVKTLLEFGADISDVTQHLTRALVLASRQNQSDCFVSLAAGGMFRTYEGKICCKYEPLIDCVQRGDFAKVDDTVSDSSNQIAADGKWESILSFLILSGCPTSVLGRVIDGAAVDVNGLNVRGFTPLISAVLAGNIECVDFLIEKGADVNKSENVSSSIDFECSWVQDESNLGLDDVKGDGKNVLPHSNALNSDDKSPLMYAVWTGRLELVEHLLVKLAEISCSDSQCRTPLLHAIHAGNLDIVNLLLSRGADVNYISDRTGKSILSEAIGIGSEDILESLLNSRVDVDGLNRDVIKACLIAAEMGEAGALKVFLNRELIDINNTDLGCSALMSAAVNNQYDCCKLIIEHGADVNVKNTREETALGFAAECGDIRLVKLLMESANGTDVESATRCILHSAAMNKNSEALRFLLSHCKNINEFNSDELTPLMCAAEQGCVNNIKLLIQHGADINIQNEYENTAVMSALECEELDCFSLLIESGADINAAPTNCDTLLVCAAKLKDSEFLEALFKSETRQVNMVSNYSGKTPLISAIQYKIEENVRLLLDNGADVNLPDNSGRTPVMHAIVQSWPDTIQLLMKAGADVNAVDGDENTLWMDALRSWECVQILLEDGSVLNNENPRKLKNIHTECGIYMNFKWDIRSLMLLFENGVFEWDWYVYGEQLSEIDKIAFSAVNAKNCSPAVFKTKEGKTTSLLQEGILGNHCRTVRYLLANLFLTMVDYKTLVCDLEFQQKVREIEDADSDNETVSLFTRVSSQPWRLETLSFLSVSSSLAVPNRGRPLTRSERVDSLVLPEIFKSKLRFENRIGKLCPRDWDSIGVGPNGLEKDLLTVNKPLFPYEQNLRNCKEDCDLCRGYGNTIVA